MSNIEPSKIVSESFWNPINKKLKHTLVEKEAASKYLQLKNLLLSLFQGKVPLAVDAKARRKVRSSLDEKVKLYHGLVTELTVVDPVHGECAAIIGEQLQEVFDLPNLGIVLLGSAVHGGSEVRKLFNESKSDFDWGLVCDSDIATTSLSDQNNLRNIADFVDEAIMLFSDHNNVTLRGCDAMNGITIHEKNLVSTKSLLSEIIQASTADVSTKIPSRLIFFFQPSYPPEINQNNQKIILEMLTLLCKIDHKKWLLLIYHMIEAWKHIHFIKRKHLTKSYGPQLDYDRSIYEKQSQREMSQPFVNLLNSTNNSLNH